MPNIYVETYPKTVVLPEFGVTRRLVYRSVIHQSQRKIDRLPSFRIANILHPFQGCKYVVIQNNLIGFQIDGNYACLLGGQWQQKCSFLKYLLQAGR